MSPFLFFILSRGISMEIIRLVIADDIEAYRRRLERIIRSVENLELIASAKSEYEVITVADALLPSKSPKF